MIRPDRRAYLSRRRAVADALGGGAVLTGVLFAAGAAGAGQGRLAAVYVLWALAGLWLIGWARG